MPKVEIPAHVHHVVTDDTVVLMNTRSGNYHGLDEVGTRFWELLVEHGDTDPAIAELLEQFDVSEERLRADMSAFLEDCAEQGLLRIAGEGA